jgi:hypothetical protein
MQTIADAPIRHPVYGLPLSGKPREWHGVTFRPYRVGVNRYAMISDDFRMEVRDRFLAATYMAVVDGKSLPTKFRTEANAAAAAIKKAAQ